MHTIHIYNHTTIWSCGEVGKNMKDSCWENGFKVLERVRSVTTNCVWAIEKQVCKLHYE